MSCDDPGAYEEPGSAPEPADPATAAACRAKGQVVDGGPTPYPAPFEDEGEHPSPGSEGGGGTPSEGGSEGGNPEETDEPTPNRPWTPTNGAMSGIQLSQGFTGHTGIYAALKVTDSRVPRNSSQYLSQRVLAKSCDNNNWFEIGWVEAGWRDNKQYIYTHDTPSSNWVFYDQYALTPGQTIYVMVTQGSNANVWQTYLWWNGGWQLLRETVNTAWLGCGGELMVDRYQTGPGTYFNFSAPVSFGDNTASGVQVKDTGTGVWKTWDKNIPSAIYSGELHCWTLYTDFTYQWYYGRTHSNNCAPNTTLSVTPTSGSRLTDFQAKLSGTFDTNGDPMNSFRIDWGDGTSSFPSSTGAVVTHRYASAGSYQVRGYACDDLFACAYSPPQSVHVDTTNSAPVINFNVTPTSGDRTTVFNANFNGTHDPENDPISYRIDWGDGTINNSQSASHRYQNAGTYTVTGRACDGFGACSTSSRTVTVSFSNRPPSANLTVTPKEGDLQTSFQATLTGADPDGDSVTYQIDWGDGTLTQSSQSQHTYESAGDYVVTGVVKDQFGAYSTDSETVRVCEVRAQGVCTQGQSTVEDTINGCFRSGTCPEDLPTEDVPDEVAEVAGPVLEQLPKISLTPKNSVLVTAANVLQAYAENDPEYQASCRNANATKTCDAPGRERRFANRLVTLSDKARSAAPGDGMGNRIPDIVLLQEARAEDARNIMRYLNKRWDQVNPKFRIAVAHEDPNVPDTAQVATECANEPDPQECAEAIEIKGDSAIIYNTDGVAPLESGVVDTKYHPDERCEFVAGVWVDEDLDGEHDCEQAKWKRHWIHGFVEVNAQGNPTGYRVAVASVHFVTKSHFQLESDFDRRAAEWANQLADRMATKFPTPRFDAYSIGGDLNNHRCDNKFEPPTEDEEIAQAFRGDYPEGQQCVVDDWWNTFEGRDYTDTIWALHRNEPTGERLVPQYADGNSIRPKRIDYIFSRLAAINASSHDLSCGGAGTCRDFANAEYYSDHRLVWAQLRP